MKTTKGYAETTMEEPYRKHAVGTGQRGDVFVGDLEITKVVREHVPMVFGSGNLTLGQSLDQMMQERIEAGEEISELRFRFEADRREELDKMYNTNNTNYRRRT